MWGRFANRTWLAPQDLPTRNDNSGRDGPPMDSHVSLSLPAVSALMIAAILGDLLKESLKCQSAGQTGSGYTGSPNLRLSRLLPFPPNLVGRHHYDFGASRAGERESGFGRLGLRAFVRFVSSGTHGSG